MSDQKIRRALISVYDKTGIVDFARALVEEFGIEIISTGGTAALLKENSIPVTLVEEITGFPEMLDGRVKTLHPKIHAAILADRDNPEHMRQLAEQGIGPIDMVVVNLYPFEQTIAKPDCTLDEAVEMIDIGGPCLLRAAAKNHKHVQVVWCPDEYDQQLHQLRYAGEDSNQISRFCGAVFGFLTTTSYDTQVSQWLSEHYYGDGERFEWLPMTRLFSLRYGENPHQSAHCYFTPDQVAGNPLPTADLPGKVGLSFNNLADATAAVELCAELTRGSPTGCSATCFIKHTNACGAAVDDDPLEAYRRSYLGAPNAAMGGILAVNIAVDEPFAEAVMDTYRRWGKAAGASGFFVEVWLATDFDEDAVTLIRTAKKWGERVRLLTVGDMALPPHPDEVDLKSIAGGLLMQNRDLVGLNEDQWKVVTKRRPTEQEMDDLRLAWLVCKHTRSNAVTICRDGMLIGNGAGQMSRVMSCRIATWLANENGHADKLPGSVAASDGFFPFRDGPDILIEAGVTAIIQPGGSKRDAETITACDEREVAMIFTGTRHFKH